MTNFLEISRRARDKYHNLKDDDLMKNIFNSGRYKDKVGMKIPDWMILEEMKQIEHYRMYAEVFGTDVPLIQSSPTESTQGTHRTPSAPRSPTYKVDAAESSRRVDFTRYITSLAEHKSRQEHEARENVALVEKHLASEEIEKMVEGQKHVVDDSSIPRNDEHNILGTRLEPRSNKESTEVGITDVIVPVNVYDEEEEEDEITDEVYELKRREKGKNVEESRITPFPTPTRSPRIHTDLQWLTHYLLWSTSILKSKFNSKFLGRFEIKFQYIAEGLIIERQKNKEEMEKMIAKAILQERGNIQAYISSQIQQVIANDIPSQADASVRSYLLGHILHVHQAQPQITSVPEQQYQLYLLMKDDPQWQQQDIAIWLAPQMKFERLQVPQTTCRTPAVRLRDRDNPHDDAHPEGENSAKQ
nr:hypothetical protein [Tanacetum cinerariifolium]